MHSADIAARVRSLIGPRNRRGLLGSVVAAVVGRSYRKAAGKRRSRNSNRKRLKPNAFGCLDVGKACRGSSSRCCSGICNGKKPKRGSKDRSTCVAHNTGGCLASEQSCGAEVPDTPCGAGGFCLRTTGNAGFCGGVADSACAACRRDADCQGVFGAGAACVVCANGSCPETDDRHCVIPAA